MKSRKKRNVTTREKGGCRHSKFLLPKYQSLSQQSWLQSLTWSSILEDCGICLLFWSLPLAGCTEFDVDEAARPLCCLFGLGGASGPCDTPSSMSWAASISMSYHPHAYTHNPVSHCSETFVNLLLEAIIEQPNKTERRGECRRKHKVIHL